MADLFRLSASEAAARIREGKLTSEALVRSCLERIGSRESQVKAWVHLDRDFALAQARECDRSASRGPIHGIPFAAKDIMDTADLPTEYGSPIYKGNHAVSSATDLLPFAGDPEDFNRKRIELLAEHGSGMICSFSVRISIC
jgi:Asp-tRNA(Asn)/Glu-tRNA(Gln) amidotransferase A subunit family amidase